MIYVDYNFVFPTDLSFLDKFEVKDKETRIFLESVKLKDLSNIEYVRPTSKSCNLLGHIIYPAEACAAMWNLYGEFREYGVDFVGKYGLLDPVEGFPATELIVLVDNKHNGEEKVSFQTLYGYVHLSSREKVDEMLALQNAFLRRPVGEADIEFLLKGLSHQNSGFRFRSAEALAKLGRSEGREFLDRQYESDDIYPKVRAADALARLGEREAIDFLQGPAQESTDKYIRIFAETTLREIGEWQPTETQYYTDESWKKHMAGDGITLPIFEEDIEKYGKQDMSEVQSDYLKLRRGE
jgi:hypothetical protein